MSESRGLRALCLVMACGVAASGLAWAAQAAEDEDVRRGRLYYKSAKYERAIKALRAALGRDGANGEAHLWLGKAYARTSGFAKAGEHLSQAVALLPKREEAYRELGRVLLELMGRRRAESGAEAAERLRLRVQQVGRQLSKVPPKEKESYEFLLRLARVSGKPQEALAHAHKVLEIDPRDVSTHLELIDLLLGLRRLDEAEASCRRALEVNPQLRRPQFALAEIRRAKGDLAGAVDVLSAALKQKSSDVKALLLRAELHLAMEQPNEALADANAALKLNPRGGLAHYVRGVVFYQSGAMDDATEEFRRAAAALPKHLQSHFALARCYLREEQLEAAIDALNTCLALQPRFAQARLMVASVQLQKGNPDGAIKILADGVRREPHQMQFRQMLATAYQHKGDRDMALRQYEEMVRQDPGAPVAHQNLAGVALAKGDAEKAVRHCERALAAAPENLHVHYLLGVAYLQLGRAGRARQELERVVERHPRHLPARTHLARALARLGEAEKAEKAFRGLAEEDPTAIGPRYALVELLARRKKLDEAEAVLKELLTIEKDKVKVYLALARLHRAGGDAAKALQAAKTALLSDPQSHEAHVLIARLHMDTQEWALALQQFATAMAANPKHPPVYDAAVLRFFLGQHDEALALFEQAIRNEVRRTPSCLAVAAVHLVKGDHRTAIASLSRVSREATSATPVVLQGANVYLAQADVTNTATVVRRARGAPEELRAAYLGLLDLCKGDAKRCQELACALARIILYGVHGWHTQAMHQCDVFLKLAPKSPLAHLLLANAYAATRQIDHEGEAVRGLVELEPGNATHRRRLARYYLARGREQEARKELEAAVAAAPKDPDARAALAALCLRQRRHDDGVEQAQAALAVAESHPHALRVLAACHLAGGKLAEAQAALERLVAAEPRSSDPLPLVELGDVHLRRGEAEKAVPRYEQALARDAKNARAQFGLAQALRHTGRAAQAVGHYRAVLALDPTNEQALLALAQIYRESRRLGLAFVTCERAARLSPDSPAIAAELLRIQLDRRQYDDVIARCQALLEQRPGHVAAQLALAEAMFESGKHQAAIARLRAMLKAEGVPAAPVRELLAYSWKRLGRADEARKELEALLQASSGTRGAFDLAALHIHARRLDDALRVAAEGAKHDRGHALQLARGTALQLKGQVAEAAAAFALATEAGTRQPQLGQFVANAHLAAGKAAEARAAFAQTKPRAELAAAYGQLVDALAADAARARQVADALNEADLYAHAQWLAWARDRYLKLLASMPHNLFVQLRLADVHERLGDAAAAATLYGHIVERQPGHELALLKLALHHRGRGDQAKAADAFRALLKARPDNLRYKQALAGSLARAGKAAEAIRLYAEVTRADRRSILAHNNLALLYATAEGHKDLKQAEALALRAASLAPKGSVAEAAVHDTLGWVHYTIGDLEKAAKFAQSAVDAQPHSAEAHYHLGMIQFKRRRWGSAYRHLELALKLDPRLPDKPTIDTTLARIRAGNQ